MKRVILILASLLLSAGPALSAPDDKLIVPGKRIGKWTLEMTIADLERMNGTARRILLRAGEAPDADAARNFTFIYWNGVNVGASTVDQKTVVDLAMFAEGTGWKLYKTDKGIGLVSTREQVLKAYGKPTAETTPGGRRPTRLIYDKVGIAFRFYADGTMSDIFVFHPGKSMWKF